MGSKIVVSVCVFLVVGIPSSRGQSANPELNNLSTFEIERRLVVLLDDDFAGRSADDLLNFAIAHSATVVPRLKSRLLSVSRAASLDFKTAIHADALAYTANHFAVDALSDLCALNPSVFCKYLERSLDYAEGRINPFTLAYELSLRTEQPVRDTLSRWVNSLISFPHFQQRLGEAMFDRYSVTPSREQWDEDPLRSVFQEENGQLRDVVIRHADNARIRKERSASRP